MGRQTRNLAATLIMSAQRDISIKPLFLMIVKSFFRRLVFSKRAVFHPPTKARGFQTENLIKNLEKSRKENLMNFLIVLSIFWVSVLVKFSRYP